MTGMEAPKRSAYAELDRLPVQVRATLVAALDALAAQPEIRRVRRAAQNALLPTPGQRILDAGCGGGEVARHLATLVAPHGEVVALDYSAATVAVAAERHDGSRVEYVVGDVEALMFPDDSFDAVRCERVLQHVVDPDRAVAELVRVTRGNGRVCLVDTDWDSMAFDGVPEDLVAAVIRHMRESPTLHHRNAGRTLRRRLVRVGLAGVLVEPVTCCFTDPAAAAVVLPMVNAQAAAEVGMVPDEIRHRWFSEIEGAGERGEFLATLTIWVAVGAKPA